MPRTARLLIPDEKAVYHVMSKTALAGYPIKSVEKDFLLKLFIRYSRLYFSEILGFCILGNHFHLLVKMIPETNFSDDDIEKRLIQFYGSAYRLDIGKLPLMRRKLANLSAFMQDIKVNFTRFYNSRHERKGYFWAGRFKSVIVDRGETLVNCLAYIDLNPLRARIVKQPEKYRWNSIGYHVQTNNKGQFLSTDFGLKEFNVRSEKERIRRYRRYMYEAGAVDRSDKEMATVIDPRLLAKEKKKGFQITLASRLRFRTRYFTDSGIIGSKEFVSSNYQRFKHLFMSKNEKIPKPVNGLSGMYSLKKLSEIL